MKKIFSICAAAAALALGSCVKERVANPTPTDGKSVAYLSIKLESRRATRGSTEASGANESDLKALYLVTFDAAGNVIAVPGSTDCYSFVDVSGGNQDEARSPEPVKVSSASKNLMVIANPGAKLRQAIVGLAAGTTFASFNAAIAGVDLSEIKDASRGFAMITAGDDKNPVNGKVLYPFVAIGDKIKVVNGADEAAATDAAIAAAKLDRLPVKLERLAAKLVVRGHDTKIAAPDNAKVALTGWTVDAINTAFYPFAEKTLLEVGHPAGDYQKNFYTRDPNYVSNPLTGYTDDLAYVSIVDYAPVFQFGADWIEPGDATNPLRIAYVIENTMAAADQNFGSSTRVIMKATYFPEFQAGSGYTDGGDWFMWDNKQYPTLAALQTAYSEPNATSALKDACDNLLRRVKTANNAIVTNDFTLLTQAQLDAITNGGQVVKDGSNPAIRWFQNSQCYYSYEVRHDNESTTSMSPGKYGVVRNNWYDLTLNSVKGPGTPWYPESKNPGPGDPDPKDPIDTKTSYLGVSISINQWVLWTTGMNDVD